MKRQNFLHFFSLRLIVILGLTSTAMPSAAHALRPEPDRAGLEAEFKSDKTDFDPEGFGFKRVRTVRTITDMGRTLQGQLYFVEAPTLSEIEGLLKNRRLEYGVYGLSVGGTSYLAVEVGNERAVGNSIATMLEELHLREPKLPIKILFDIHNHHRMAAFPSRQDFLSWSSGYLAPGGRKLAADRYLLYGPRTGRLMEYGVAGAWKHFVPKLIRLRVWKKNVKRPVEHEFGGTEGAHVVQGRHVVDERSAWLERFSRSIGRKGVVRVEVGDSSGHWVRWEKDITLASVLQSFLARPDRAGLEQQLKPRAGLEEATLVVPHLSSKIELELPPLGLGSAGKLLFVSHGSTMVSQLLVAHTGSPPSTLLKSLLHVQKELPVPIYIAPHQGALDPSQFPPRPRQEQMTLFMGPYGAVARYNLTLKWSRVPKRTVEDFSFYSDGRAIFEGLPVGAVYNRSQKHTVLLGYKKGRAQGAVVNPFEKVLTLVEQPRFAGLKDVSAMAYDSVHESVLVLSRDTNGQPMVSAFQWDPKSWQYEEAGAVLFPSLPLFSKNWTGKVNLLFSMAAHPVTGDIWVVDPYFGAVLVFHQQLDGQNRLMGLFLHHELPDLRPHLSIPPAQARTIRAIPIAIPTKQSPPVRNVSFTELYIGNPYRDGSVVALKVALREKREEQAPSSSWVSSERQTETGLEPGSPFFGPVHFWIAGRQPDGALKLRAHDLVQGRVYGALLHESQLSAQAPVTIKDWVPTSDLEPYNPHRVSTGPWEVEVTSISETSVLLKVRYTGEGQIHPPEMEKRIHVPRNAKEESIWLFETHGYIQLTTWEEPPSPEEPLSPDKPRRLRVALFAKKESGWDPLLWQADVTVKGGELLLEKEPSLQILKGEGYLRGAGFDGSGSLVTYRQASYQVRDIPFKARGVFHLSLPSDSPRTLSAGLEPALPDRAGLEAELSPVRPEPVEGRNPAAGLEERFEMDPAQIEEETKILRAREVQLVPVPAERLGFRGAASARRYFEFLADPRQGNGGPMEIVVNSTVHLYHRNVTLIVFGRDQSSFRNDVDVLEGVLGGRTRFRIRAADSQVAYASAELEEPKSRLNEAQIGRILKNPLAVEKGWARESLMWLEERLRSWEGRASFLLRRQVRFDEIRVIVDPDFLSNFAAAEGTERGNSILLVNLGGPLTADEAVRLLDYTLPHELGELIAFGLPEARADDPGQELQAAVMGFQGHRFLEGIRLDERLLEGEGPITGLVSAEEGSGVRIGDVVANRAALLLTGGAPETVKGWLEHGRMVLDDIEARMLPAMLVSGAAASGRLPPEANLSSQEIWREQARDLSTRLAALAQFKGTWQGLEPTPENAQRLRRVENNAEAILGLLAEAREYLQAADDPAAASIPDREAYELVVGEYAKLFNGLKLRSAEMEKVRGDASAGLEAELEEPFSPLERALAEFAQSLMTAAVADDWARVRWLLEQNRLAISYVEENPSQRSPEILFIIRMIRIEVLFSEGSRSPQQMAQVTQDFKRALPSMVGLLTLPLAMMPPLAKRELVQITVELFHELAEGGYLRMADFFGPGAPLQEPVVWLLFSKHAAWQFMEMTQPSAQRNANPAHGEMERQTLIDLLAYFALADATSSADLWIDLALGEEFLSTVQELLQIYRLMTQQITRRADAIGVSSGFHLFHAVFDHPLPIEMPSRLLREAVLAQDSASRFNAAAVGLRRLGRTARRLNLPVAADFMKNQANSLADTVVRQHGAYAKAAFWGQSLFPEVFPGESAGLESASERGDSWKKAFFAEIEQLLGDADLTLPDPLRRAFEAVDRGQFFPGRTWFGHTMRVAGDPPGMPQGTEPRLIAWMILQTLSPERLERLLADHPTDPVRVLVEGAGSGYSTAVLDGYLNNVLGRGRYQIIALEVNSLYYQWAAERLGENNPDIQLIQNPPEILGWPKEAPYDVILTFAQTNDQVARAALLRQLRVGGRLVLPWAESADSEAGSTLEVYQREPMTETNPSVLSRLDDARFVPLQMPQLSMEQPERAGLEQDEEQTVQDLLTHRAFELESFGSVVHQRSDGSGILLVSRSAQLPEISGRIYLQAGLEAPARLKTAGRQVISFGPSQEEWPDVQGLQAKDAVAFNRAHTPDGQALTEWLLRVSPLTARFRVDSETWKQVKDLLDFLGQIARRHGLVLEIQSVGFIQRGQDQYLLVRFV